MNVVQRTSSVVLVLLLVWGQVALAQHVLVHATPDLETCEYCVSQAQSSGGIAPQSVFLVVIENCDSFFQTPNWSHFSLLPTRPQQPRAPPFIT